MTTTLPKRKVGTIWLEDRRWVIDAAPHVALRFKRVFWSTSNDVGLLTLADTDQNCADLLWFMEKFPLEIQHKKDAAHMRARAKRNRERESDVERLLSGHHAPIGTWELAIPPRQYQLEAAALTLATRGLLLADDVGLGKTASAICTFTDARTLPALVVTLAHLPRQWESEIQKFAPRLRVHVIKRGAPYDIRKPPRLRKSDDVASGLLFERRHVEQSLPDVIVINYAKLHKWAETLAPIVKSVVFDEVQELRHAKNSDNTVPLKYAAANHVSRSVDFRMGLSATPIYNYGEEIHSVLDVLSPGTLGSKGEFMTEWGTASQLLRDPAAFGTYARSAGLMLRRTRAEVGRELPAVSRIPHHVEADTKALDDVAESVAELAKIILGEGETEKGQKRHASEEISWKLRQATGIGKAPYVAEFVRLLVESGEKVVLYGWHREVYRIWQERLRDLNPVLYTGTESIAQKEQSKREFVEWANRRVLIISLRAGAGLDGLQQVCRTVVFGELDWSPGVFEQCIGRVARDGQKDPVAAYFLVSDHGADPVLADVLELKEQQAAGIRDPDAPLVEQLQVDPQRIKRLAVDYLTRRGLPLPTPTPKPPPAEEAAAQ